MDSAGVRNGDDARMPSLAFHQRKAAPPRRWTARMAAGDIPTGLFAAAMLLFMATQLLSGLTMPLSMDEGFSAVIAAQPDPASLIRWCLAELSGPVYYSILWGWEKLAGDANVALRLPGLAFALAAPWLLWAKGPGDRTTRALWAVTVALWVPALANGTEVRPYSLILLLASAQAIAFLRLIEAPDTRRALLWTGLSTLAVLTHYHAAVIAGLQGLAFVGIWRMRAVRCWPALLPLAPMAVWMMWHLPLLLKFTGAGGWYLPLGFGDVVHIPLLFFGSVGLGALLVAAMATTFYARLRQGASSCLRFDASTAEIALAGSGVGAFLIVLAAGFVWPSFIPRYLIAYAPAMLFVVPLWLRGVARVFPAALTLIVIAVMATAAVSVADRIAHPEYTARYSFGVERPSRWIAEQGGADRLVFFWDNPTAALADPARMAEVGGYFLAREGRPAAEVVLPRYPAGGDPNPVVARLARGDGAVIWIYDAKVPGTMSARFPPKLRQDRAHWNCRDFGSGYVIVLACIPRRTAAAVRS